MRGSWPSFPLSMAMELDFLLKKKRVDYLIWRWFICRPTWRKESPGKFFKGPSNSQLYEPYHFPLLLWEQSRIFCWESQKTHASQHFLKCDLTWASTSWKTTLEEAMDSNSQIELQHGKKWAMGKESWKALVISLDKPSLVLYKEYCASATKMILKI